MNNQTKARRVRAQARRQSGFTLMEMMIVIFIIGVLAAVAAPRVSKIMDGAKEKACMMNRKAIDMAKHSWSVESLHDSRIAHWDPEPTGQAHSGTGFQPVQFDRQDACPTPRFMESRKQDGDAPTEEDIRPWLDDQKLPGCPAGGAYALGTVGVKTTCSVHGPATVAP